MSIFGFSFTEHSDLAEPYKTFVRQMSKWYNGGEMPELASQDLRFALELQRQKLQKARRKLATPLTHSRRHSKIFRIIPESTTRLRPHSPKRRAIMMRQSPREKPLRQP